LKLTRLTRRHKTYFTAALFVTPVVLGITLFKIVPIISALRVSFFDYNLLSEMKTYLGLENYRLAVLYDTRFHHSLLVTLVFAVCKVAIQVALGLALAMVVRQKITGIGAVRSMIFVPVVTSMVVVATVWNLIYHPTEGVLNSILSLFGVPPKGFLINPRYALPSVLAMTVWKDVGFTMIILLSGLQSIPETYYEAAAIDGASKIQSFRHITLPLLRPALMYVIVTITVFSFQVFTPVYIMTQGGPLDSTRVVAYNIYENAFVYMKMGYASALSVMLFAIILVISLVQMRIVRGGESA